MDKLNDAERSQIQREIEKIGIVAYIKKVMGVKKRTKDESNKGLLIKSDKTKKK